MKLIIFKNCCLDLTRILGQSRDYDEQLHLWKSWRDAVGPPLRHKYERYVQLANQAAQQNGQQHPQLIIINFSVK